MRARSTRRAIAALGAAGILIVAAGCGSDDNSSSSSSDTTSTAAAPAKKAIKVGLVTDIGGLNDRSFNSLANKGLQDSKATLGVTGRVLTSKSNADYVPNLSTLAQQNYDLVIGVGFLMADAVGTVAKKFPNTKFAIIDVDATTLEGKPTNVEGLLFKEQQSGYLAGYLAGLYAKDNNITTISSVGGQKIPPVDHYIAGYQAGAKAANPDIKTLNAYSEDFVDQAKCKEIALSQIACAARASSSRWPAIAVLGALDAAKEKSKQGIGVDADQSYLGPFIWPRPSRRSTSRCGTVKQVQADKFTGGTNTTFEVANDGAGLGKISAVGAKYQPQIDEVTAKLKDNRPPPDTVKASS